MAVWKKIVYPLAALLLFAGYIALAAFVLNTFFKPSQTAEGGVNFGAYHIKNADGVQDADIDNDETAFNNIDGGLLYSGDSVLSGLKLVKLWEVRLIEGQIEGGSIEIEISQDLFEDTTFAVVHRNEARELVLINAQKEIRTKENGEQYRVVVFEVQDTGYYGIASQRKVARFDWLLAAFCIATVCGLFVLLFIVLQGKTEKHRALKE